MTIAEQILPIAESLVKKVIESECDKIVDAALAAIEKAIPGTVDDTFIEQAKPAIKEEVKALLLKLADKIDGQEG